MGRSSIEPAYANETDTHRGRLVRTCPNTKGGPIVDRFFPIVFDRRSFLSLSLSQSLSLRDLSTTCRYTRVDTHTHTQSGSHTGDTPQLRRTHVICISTEYIRRFIIFLCVCYKPSLPRYGRFFSFLSFLFGVSIQHASGWSGFL